MYKAKQSRVAMSPSERAQRKAEALVDGANARAALKRPRAKRPLT